MDKPQRIKEQLALMEVRPSPRPLSKLLQQAIEVSKGISPGPWVADTKESMGENWLVGCVMDCGLTHKDESYIVTTYHVRASEMDGDAESDALFIAFARTAWPEIIEHLYRLAELEL